MKGPLVAGLVFAFAAICHASAWANPSPVALKAPSGAIAVASQSPSDGGVLVTPEGGSVLDAEANEQDARILDIGSLQYLG